MRTSLIVFGIIFLVIGGFLYFVPLQNFNVDTATAGSGGTNTQTSSASFTVPMGWALVFAIIGLFLLVLGLAIPGPRAVKVVQGPRGPRGRSSVRYRRPVARRLKRADLSGSTSVTTTTTRVKR